ncbi:MAG: Z-ring formation inhibitor MciZ [Bacillus sp. (in: firmicutes)]
MKITVGDKQIILSGKAWEIRHKLKEYGNKYTYITDWVKDEQKIVNLHLK